MRSRPHSRSFARVSTLVLGCALSLIATRSSAQPADDKAQARTLFDTAMQLMKQGTYTEDVCGKLATSQKLDPQLGTAFYWAECLEHTGKLASAWTMYLDVSEQARAQKLPDQEKFAAGRAAALKPRIAKLIVVVPDDLRSTPGLAVLRDDAPLSAPQWGTSLPVDGGKHTITVSATGRRQWTTTVEVPIGNEGATITVTVPALQAEPDVGPIGGKRKDEGAEKTGWSGQHTVGVAAAGAGLVALGFMGGFGLDSASKHQASMPHCSADRKFCDQAGLDLEHQAHASATASNISLAVGAGLIASGALVFILAPSLSSGKSSPGTKPSPPVQGISAAVTAGPEGTGFLLKGAF